MTLSALGIFSAAGAGGAPQTYELIETVILGSSQASVTFSNLGQYSSTYRHLQLRLLTRGTNSESSNNVSIRFNGDTGSNYAFHNLEAGYVGSSVVSGGATSVTKAIFAVGAGSTTTANVFGGGVADILDPFSTTKNKTVRTFSGNSSNDPVVALRGSLWMSTSSVTSITIDQWITANFVAGSRFSLYGIKG